MVYSVVGYDKRIHLHKISITLYKAKPLQRCGRLNANHFTKIGVVVNTRFEVNVLVF